MNRWKVTVSLAAMVVLLGVGVIVIFKLRYERDLSLMYGGRHAMTQSLICLKGAIFEGLIGVIAGNECPNLSWRARTILMVMGGGTQPIVWAPDCNRMWYESPNSDFPLRYPDIFCRPGSAETSVMAVVGPDSALAALAESPDSVIPEDTIIIVEVIDSGIHWQEPGDLNVDGSCTNSKAHPRIGGPSSHGFHVGFYDGEVWRLRNDTPLELIIDLFNIDVARSVERSDVLGQYRVPMK